MSSDSEEEIEFLSDMENENETEEFTMFDEYDQFREINKRAGHIATAWREGAILWGGYSEEEPFMMGHEYYLPSQVWHYTYLTDSWKKHITTGDIPNRSSGAGGCVLDDHFYIVAGFQQVEGGSLEETFIRIQISNSMWRLNLHNWVWTKMNPGGIPPLRCDKTSLWSYSGRVYMFGGYGPHMAQPDFAEDEEDFDLKFISAKSKDPLEGYNPVRHLFKFTADDSSNAFTRGWSNQLLYFDRDKEEWIWPTCHGEAPSPRACHSTVVIGNKCYLFGGRHQEQRLNDLHCLDMDTHTWRCVIPHVPDSPPLGRSWQSMSPYYTGKDAGGLLLYGGFDNEENALGDCWKLDLESDMPNWVRMTHLEQGPRLWHSSVSVNSAITLVIGGLTNNILAPNHIPKLHAKQVLNLQVGPSSLLASALQVICKHKSQFYNCIQDLPHNLKQILELRLL